MKNLAILAFALIVSGSAFAAENLTAAQMDTVSAGARHHGGFFVVHQHINQVISVKGSHGVVHHNQVISVKGSHGVVHHNQFISVKGGSHGVQVVAPVQQVVAVGNGGDVTSVQQTWVQSE